MSLEKYIDKKPEYFRDNLFEFTRLDLVGPFHYDKEEIKSKKIYVDPSRNYSAGILWPNNDKYEDRENNTDENINENYFIDELDDFEISDIKAKETVKQNLGIDTKEDKDDSIFLANQLSPSSLAITFLVDQNCTLKINLFFATYTDEDIPYTNSKGIEKTYKEYTRSQHSFQEKIDMNDMQNLKDLKLHDGLFRQIRVRKYRDCYALTIGLINKNKEKGYKNCYYQPEIIVENISKGFRAFEAYTFSSEDEEIESFNLLYRSKKDFCRGHGCAGDWLDDDKENVLTVFSNIIPTHEIKPIIPEENLRYGGDVSFSFFNNSLPELNVESAKEKIIDNLNNFIDDYNKWIDNISKKSFKLNEQYLISADKHIKECKKAAERIKNGIKTLQNNNVILNCFRHTNHAMYLQQVHWGLKAGESFNKSEINKFKKVESAEKKQRGWRPFQLAFLLMNINSIPRGDIFSKEENNIIDLIWFPTGGGKTEAYLGLAAFSMIYSKLLNPNLINTEIIMRYTLRLLTAQQFERANCLILALEYLRLQGVLGENLKNSYIPFSSGLWVGTSLTPNRNDFARKRLKKLRDKKNNKNVFLVLDCPWCKNSLTENNYQGYREIEKNVGFYCVNNECDFFDSKLPISVIDEQLYENPPTLLLGTIDKFAQLSWSSKGGVFFGKNDKSLPPSLIIQDELHLITGPLGTVAANYEILIELIIKHHSKDYFPKIIASSATIRRSKEQIKSIYNKECNIFPPPGIDYFDSYFAKEVSDTENFSGRKYVGFLLSSTNSMITSEVNLISPLLQFPRIFFSDVLEESLNSKTGRKFIKIKEGSYLENLNPYGTIVWYFNAMKELSYARDLITSDIIERLNSYPKKYDINNALRVRDAEDEELTGRLNEADISKILKKLELNWMPSPKDFKSIPIDILLATNMISVGIDIDRLGLMVINGQPKYTSEYIQASSRVGRKFPGLIFTLYNHAKTRDRSHYEMFKSYHQSFYRAVEPVSITPFAPNARERCLPGIIFGIARNILELEDPNKYNDEVRKKIQNYMQVYYEKLNTILKSESEVEACKKQVEEILNKWTHKKNNNQKISYGDIGRKIETSQIMIEYGTDYVKNHNRFIHTLTSMRGVDASSTSEVVLSEQEL